MPCNLYRCELPLHRPLATSRGEIAGRTSWVVELTDDRGHVGLGEAAPLLGFGGEDPEACDRVLNQVIQKLTPDLVQRWLDRGKADAPLGMQIEPLLASFPCARHAIEGALIDLLAQSQDMPVAGLLNESAAVSVPVNALAATPEDAGRAVRDGFKTVKLKADKEPLVAAYTAIAARAAMGAGSILRMDANGAWTLDEALTFADAAVAAQLEFIEQPLAVGDYEGMTAFRRRCRMPIAVDESVRTAADVGRVGAAQAADIVVLKPQFLGGWRHVKQAIQLARTCGLEPIITTAIDGSIGRAFATHMAAACNLALRANGLATGQLLVADLTSEPLIPNKGTIMVRERPGLGIGTLGG